MADFEWKRTTNQIWFKWITENFIRGRQHMLQKMELTSFKPFQHCITCIWAHSLKIPDSWDRLPSQSLLGKILINKLEIVFLVPMLWAYTCLKVFDIFLEKALTFNLSGFGTLSDLESKSYGLKARTASSIFSSCSFIRSWLSHTSVR
jgi:hypothetical protein